MARNDPTPQVQLLNACNKIEQLAAAPRTLGRVLQLLRHPDSGIHAIAELISRDSGLAADVLRCANSAFYNRSVRVAAVNEAVQVIGFHETIRIVSLIAIRQTTHRDLTSYGLPAEDFWAESLFNGLFLEALARRTGTVDPGEAYTAGLLRFIGRLAINQAIEDLGFGLFWDRTLPLSEWETANIGLTQGEIGGRLLRRWGFPETTARAIETQEATTAPECAGTPYLACIVQFAAQLLPGGCRVEELEPLLGRVATIALHPLVADGGLPMDAVGSLLTEAHAGLVAIRETLYR